MRTRHLIAAPAVLLGCALGLGGCSTDSVGSATPASAPAAGSARFSTPEQAVQEFLRAIGRGDAPGACRVMAAGGRAIETEPQAFEMCVPAMTQAAQGARQGIGDGMAEATVAGAVVSGDTADLSRVTTTPASAAEMVRGMQAVRIGGGWYVSAS